MARITTPLPGYQAPAASFDQPFEMLSACHDRVRRTLALLQRLVDHLQTNGVDDSARSAAHDVLRYFDIAAPHHHEDEERHLFPRLLAGGDAALADAVHRLQSDHLCMSATWGALRSALVALRDGTREHLTAADEALAAEFIGLYGEHMRIEDERVFPAALAATPPGEIGSIGDEMAARRGATRPEGATTPAARESR